jgi:hypothetical protein
LAFLTQQYSSMTTAISNPTLDHTATTNPLAQLRAARQKPIAAIIGATAGLVPVGVYEVGHHELTSWSPLECPKAMIVYAGLLFSALTVLGWSTNMFGSKAKALGFTLLLEGLMMASSAAWLTAIALTYLVLINAVANGCRLALRDVEPAATGVTDWASNLGRALAAAAGATAAAIKRERPDHVGVDWSANLGQALAAAAGATVAVAKKATRARRRRRTDVRKTQPRLALVAPELWS